MAPLAFLLLFPLVCLSAAEISSKIGINYGQIGNNLPSPNRSVELIKSMKIGRVKLYDANPEILRLLSGTNISVSIMVPNNEITGIASDQSKADEWVRNNVIPYYPETMIRYLLVGNEILSYFSDQDRRLWHDVVPAMTKIKHSLKAKKITNIKIGTPLAMDVLQTSFPPSSGAFRSDVSETVMVPLLSFLIFAMTKLGYPHIRLLIAETGWPNSGGEQNQPGANVQNAATYNRNLVQKIVTKPTIGTPARPGVVIPTFIFSLYDENQKGGPGTERHWGLLYTDGNPVYDIDLTGKRPVNDYKPLPEKGHFIKRIHYDD
ncbi:hypothetical protein ACLB2K_040264 [Fragaria x ananassa]